MPGLIALAVAMGIGRFAFTPLLPMMQSGAGMSVAEGGWLASANYLGYLAGALLALRMRGSTGSTIRAGLVLVAVTTAGMAFTDNLVAWLVLRFAAGVASAWVLVFVSSWGFARPAVVFSGVGIGIAATGLVCLALMALGAAWERAWIVLGAVSSVVAIALWPTFHARVAGNTAAEAPDFTWTPEAWRLVACYGAFGFGYIIPATFLPVMAREAMDDPALFGWSWPVFGAAAALSTLLAGTLRKAAGDRTIWIAANAIMAAGVVLALFSFVIAAALLVGGTFMVITMVGIQEARRVAGAGARTLIAAMTSAFAAGQIAGPLVVSAAGGFPVPLAFAAALLAACALVLWRFR